MTFQMVVVLKGKLFVRPHPDLTTHLPSAWNGVAKQGLNTDLWQCSKTKVLFTQPHPDHKAQLIHHATNIQ